MFDMKLSIYEFLYVFMYFMFLYNISVRDCWFTSSAGTFHPYHIFNIRRFCHHWILHKSYKKCGLLKSICMFKVSNIYYTYELRTHSINQAFSNWGEDREEPPPPHPPLAANCLLPTRKFPLVDSSHQSCIHPRIFNNNFYVITWWKLNFILITPAPFLF